MRRRAILKCIKQEAELGARFFGNWDNNLWQYNLAWFRRLEKDTNSGLNDVFQTPRKDDIFVANVYRQDFPILGLTSQHYVAVWGENEFYRNFMNSMLVTAGVVTISLTVGTLAGYGLLLLAYFGSKFVLEVLLQSHWHEYAIDTRRKKRYRRKTTHAAQGGAAIFNGVAIENEGR